MMSISINNNQILITEQTFFPGSDSVFHATNGVEIRRSGFPAAYYSFHSIRLYVRGSDLTKNNWPIMLKNTNEVLKCVEALKEFCEYYYSEFKIVYGRVVLK